MDDWPHSPHRVPTTPAGSVELRVRVEHHGTASGDVDVLSMSGNLDLQGLLELRRALPPHLAQLLPAARDDGTSRAGGGARSATGPGTHAPRPHLVIADLGGVAFLDSSGVGGLISLHRRLGEGGGRFAVCCLQPLPGQVLSMTGTDRVLSVHPTLADALRDFPPAPPDA